MQINWVKSAIGRLSISSMFSHALQTQPIHSPLIEHGCLMKTREELRTYSVQHGLSLKEYHLLICCFDGQMTDGEICCELSVEQEQLNELVQGLKARALIGRRKGILVASIEGRSAYYGVPPLAA